MLTSFLLIIQGLKKLFILEKVCKSCCFVRGCGHKKKRRIKNIEKKTKIENQKVVQKNKNQHSRDKN